MTHTDDTDALANAIRAAACTGDCNLTEEECEKANIRPSVFHHGHMTEVVGTPEAFAHAIRPVVLTQAADRLTAKYGVTNRAAGDLRRLATETQRECPASISGNCLRERENDTACGTETGECVHGGRPAVKEAHPSHNSWFVELRMEDGHWAVAFPTHDRDKAVERLTLNRQRSPHRQWRLVQHRETYTVEETP